MSDSRRGPDGGDLYDADGNLLSDGVTGYTWNARGQLTASTKAGVQSSYGYDGLGRRTAKTVAGTKTGYLYDGLNTVAGLSGTTATATMLTGGVDQVFARTSGGVTRSLLTDALGSTLAVADSTGAVTGEYSYQPFGATTLTGTDGGNPTRYAGREDDGSGLYFNRARYYSATDQRFLSQDPLGFGSGDTNLYAYTSNQPTDLVDPLGTKPQDMSGGGSVVYRNLHEGEDHTAGLTAKNPSATYKPGGHITNGSKPNFRSQYISTTNDINVAKKWNKGRLVEINLDKFDGIRVDSVGAGCCGDPRRNGQPAGREFEGSPPGGSCASGGHQMDWDDMSGEAERLEQASGDFLVALRANDGFQQPVYDRLAGALRECATAWRHENCIPRLGANVLVDIVPATQAAADAYPEPVRQQIYDASFELYDLVTECVALNQD